MGVDTPEDKKKEDAKEKLESTKDQNAHAATFAELLFVLVPFVAIAIAFGYRGQLHTIFFIPEWSIVSAVISGQSIVRVASLAVGKNIHKERFVLVLTVLLVCLLVPALLVLTIVLTSDRVSYSLAIFQGLIFIVSIIVFYLVSWVVMALGN